MSYNMARTIVGAIVSVSILAITISYNRRQIMFHTDFHIKQKVYDLANIHSISSYVIGIYPY